MKTKTLFCLSSLALPLLFAGRANANPVGGQVQAGVATIGSPAPGVLNINQTTDKVIINWSEFSIAAGELTKFIQPSASSAALNRVISANPSSIYGSLQGNGHIYLINQNGILVGPGGQVNTRSFVASTLDIKNESFLAGVNLTLSGNSTASVNNQGSIGALGGDVFLIAHMVENSGSISAPQGTIGLAAGSSVQLVQSGQERISVLAGNSAAAQTAKGVNNIGTLEATTAELKAAGGNIYALAINNGGVVRATSLVNENGHIVLKSSGGNIANSGTLSAHNANGSGGSITLDGGHNATDPSTVINSGTIEARGDAAGIKGGQVKMLGDHVGLFDQALVDVSGDAGGGSVLVGGDYQGKNSAVQNSQGTFVGSQASIKADALTTGNGGRVIVWSDRYTQFYGNVSGRGGSQSGNGGFAEISGKQALDFQGTVDFRAPHGRVGKLLLDPKNITVATGGAGVIANNSTFAQNPGANVTFSPSSLVSALGGADVTLQANNNITFNNSVDVSGDSSIHNLTLQAGNSIFLNNATINLTPDSTTATSGGAFTATFNDVGASAANRDAGAATFTMTGSSSIIAAGGITIQGGTFGGTAAAIDSNTGDISLTTLNTTPSSRVSSSGDITIINNAAPGKNITVTGTLSANGATALGGNNDGDPAGAVNLTASGAISVSKITVNGGNGNNNGDGGAAGSVTLTAGTSLTLNNSISAFGGNSPGSGASGSDGTITFNHGGALTGTGLVSSATLNLNGGGDVGAIGSRLNTAVGSLILNKSGGDSFISQAGALSLKGTTAGSLNAVAGGNITQSGSLVVNGAGRTASFDAGTHDITLNDA
ncbi:MAG: hypothetical protein JWQ71_1836, partial [Pedosphaera sp.]|nr:hypothetical protein [Pedosphaera sp.]